MINKLIPNNGFIRRAPRLIIVIGATLVYLFSSSSLPSYGKQSNSGANQQGAHHHHNPSGQAAEKEDKGEGMKLSIPDVELFDQDGNLIHFYSDLVKGKVVAINFIFTTCTTICPPLAATFSKVQSQMSARLGKEFSLISISVDPVTDTPERLKAWGAKFGRKQGWTFVTGKKTEIDVLLKALKAYSARKEDHTPMVIIGNEAKGKWTRAYGLAPAARLAGIIEEAIKGPATEFLVKEGNPK